jgi:hypothetical protein
MPVTNNRQPRLFVFLLLIALSFAMVGNASAAQFPESIPLPNGFQPEGIASGPGTTFFVGSIPTGAIYRGDIETGEGEILVPAQEGRSAIGLKYDPNSGLLFVAGGATGFAYVYDAETGENVAEIQLTDLPSFINDVVLTGDAAYFTNSFQPIIYRVPLLPKGQFPDTPMVEEITLGGEYQFTPGAFNANGIAATPGGERLIIVNSTEGALYNVDPATGVATRIDLGTGAVPNGDGILLRGRTLYVVQNRLNQVAVIRMNSDFTAGTITTTISSPLFRVPTTIAGFGKSLYVVNARFGTPPTPDTDYDVVRVPDA